MVDHFINYDCPTRTPAVLRCEVLPRDRVHFQSLPITCSNHPQPPLFHGDHLRCCGSRKKLGAEIDSRSCDDVVVVMWFAFVGSIFKGGGAFSEGDNQFWEVLTQETN